MTLWRLLIISSLLVGGLGSVSVSVTAASPSVSYISTVELKAERSSAQPPLVLDVRSEVEYVNGHIPGAKFWPLKDIGRASDIANYDEQIVTYCGATECQASREAAEEMISDGFQHVRVLTGGFPAWEKMGYDVIQGAESGAVTPGLSPNAIAFGTVLGVGLADGINPCAIGMLVFLLGYLIVFAKRPDRVLNIGTIYIVTVYVTYFLIGMAFYRILVGFSQTPEYATISFFIHLILGVILLVAGGINLKDFFLPGRGFSLEIPQRIRPFLQSWVAKATPSATIVLGALVTVFEMPCSLPLYAGTLDILARSGLSRAATLGYLGIYNLMFVLPLLIILIVVYSGKKITMVKEWEHRSKKWMKLLMGGMLVGFGMWLLMT